MHYVVHAGWTGSLTAGAGASWNGYELSFGMRPSAWASEVDGVMFAINGSNHYNLMIVGGNKLNLSKVISGTETRLASTTYAFTGGTWYTLDAYMTNGVLSIYVNSKLVMQASDSTLKGGGIAFQANDPVAFDNVVVTQLASTPTTTTPVVSPSPAARI